MIVHRKTQPSVRAVLEDIQTYASRVVEANPFGPDSQPAQAGGGPAQTGAQQKPIPPTQAKKATDKAGKAVATAVSGALRTGSRVAAGAKGGVDPKRMAKGAQEPIPAQETPEQRGDELEASGKAVEKPEDREALQAVIDKEKKKQSQGQPMAAMQDRQPAPGARAPGARMEGVLSERERENILDEVFE